MDVRSLNTLFIGWGAATRPKKHINWLSDESQYPLHRVGCCNLSGANLRGANLMSQYPLHRVGCCNALFIDDEGEEMWVSIPSS